jgi:hypothetical protein
MNTIRYPFSRPPLDLGALVTLVTLGVAGILGFIAVLDADNVASAFGTGLGVAFAIFLAGTTIACALACLKRGRLELPALGSTVAAGLATDLLVLAILLDIDNDAYGKIAGILFVWSFFALIVLGLTLAVENPQFLARLLYLGSIAAAVAAGLISTWLIATAGDTSIEGNVFGPVGVAVDDDGMLRALGASLVLLSSLWVGALAASRIDRGAPSTGTIAAPTV